MKCMSVNPPPLHFPLCFNSPANTEDVIGVSLVLLTLQGFASHHAIMMHNNCLYIFCQDTLIKHPTQSPSLWHQT